MFEKSKWIIVVAAVVLFLPLSAYGLSMNPMDYIDYWHLYFRITSLNWIYFPSFAASVVKLSYYGLILLVVILHRVGHAIIHYHDGEKQLGDLPHVDMSKQVEL